MALLAGMRATADRLNHLQSTTYGAIGSGTVAASSTDADVTDATVTLTTETDNAQYMVIGVWDFNATGIPGGSSTGRLNIDTVGQSPLATFRGDAANDRGTMTQTYQGTLGTAGSHTLKLTATTSTNTQVLGTNSSITIVITEVTS